MLMGDFMELQAQSTMCTTNSVLLNGQCKFCILLAFRRSLRQRVKKTGRIFQCALSVPSKSNRNYCLGGGMLPCGGGGMPPGGGGLAPGGGGGMLP